MQDFIKRLQRYKKFALSKRKKKDIDSCIKMAEHVGEIYSWVTLLHVTPERLEKLKKELKEANNV